VRFLDHDNFTAKPENAHLPDNFNYGHPNVSGTRRMWHEICKTNNELRKIRVIRLNTSFNSYMAGKLADLEPGVNLI